jgi:hypothetical protein
LVFDTFCQRQNVGHPCTLYDIISISGLNYREVKSERHNFEINYHLPEEIQLISIEGLNIFIDFGLRGSYSNIPTKIDLVQYSTIRLETTQENKFNFFEDIAIYIGKFLSLCSFSKSIPFECEFLNSNSNYKSKIEVLRSGYNSKDFSNNSTSDPIISFKELSFNKFILQNYLENRSNYEIVINLLFDTRLTTAYRSASGQALAWSSTHSALSLRLQSNLVPSPSDTRNVGKPFR